MRILLVPLFLALSAAAAPPATPPAEPYGQLRQIIAPVSGARMKATVEKLVSFGTRHTLSSQTDPKRGIGAAQAWVASQFEADSKGCGGCLTIVTPEKTFTGERSPNGVTVKDVVAIQRGTERPNEVIIITGHLDSRVSDVMNATADAPGANDDGSGIAAVLEAARVLSKHTFPATIVYAALTGEEQGLYGGTTLADYARAQNWDVVADLNNDIIGNSCGSDGVCDSTHVRVFSEGPRWQGHEWLAAAMRSRGGENDAPSRNISRFLDGLADHLSIGLDVRQVWRSDRFGRGGDHLEFLEQGLPAVRLTVAVENYQAQHQDLRTEKGVRYGDTIDRMDFAYLEKIAKLNIAGLAAMASAPPPPAPSAEGAVATDTTLTWNPAPSATSYIARWRRTDANQWQESRRVESCGVACTLVLPHIRVDDWVFGVSSVGKNGFESPVASAVPGGQFGPIPEPVSKPPSK